MSTFHAPVKIGQLCRSHDSAEIVRLVRVSDGVATVRREDGTHRVEPLAMLTREGVTP